jgi:lipopolysaccharide transport system ATP-binding protein
MSQGVVLFDRVWKKFQRGDRHTSLRDLIPAVTRRLVTGPPKTDELQNREFWALKDVSFQVQPGEALGIIGPNGAGKSTALKLLTKILRPSRGACSIKGRVGALIEVAAGFHPDLTGRENIFLQGAIMGMKRVDITRKLDDIIEFSGIQDFIDTPVKRYSSGMNARLGFSIAANLDPDVLVIDEVLAVGDMAFQQRCIERMQEFRRSGVAIVFVSHNLQAVSTLCQKAVFLAGAVRLEGPPDEVIRAYVNSAAAEVEAAENDEVRIVSSRLVDSAGAPVTGMVAPGQPLCLETRYLPKITAENVTFELLLYRSTDNLLLYAGHFTNAELGLPKLVPGRGFEVDFEFRANLTRGHYHVMTRVYDNVLQHFVAQVCPHAGFVVDELQTWGGIVHLDVKTHTHEISGTPGEPAMVEDRQ